MFSEDELLLVLFPACWVKFVPLLLVGFIIVFSLLRTVVPWLITVLFLETAVLLFAMVDGDWDC